MNQITEISLRLNSIIKTKAGSLKTFSFKEERQTSGKASQERIQISDE